MTPKLCRTALLFALAAALPAQAHYLWFEPSGDAAQLCFGEYENALREKTGGRLDSIAAPAVRTLDGKPVAMQRKADHLALAARAAMPLVAEEPSMKVADLRKHHIGIVKPMYYARLAAGKPEVPSRLALDIRPLADGRVVASLHGKPLAKAKLQVYAPNRWMREVETDAAGEAVVETPWPGLYVIEAVHVEPVAGQYQGEAYEAVRHVSTLSLLR